MGIDGRREICARRTWYFASRPAKLKFIFVQTAAPRCLPASIRLARTRTSGRLNASIAIPSWLYQVTNWSSLFESWDDDPRTIFCAHLIVVCVCNLGPKNIAGFTSELLLLGAKNADGKVIVLGLRSEVAVGEPIFQQRALPLHSKRSTAARPAVWS